jgi:hypothetical protein
MRPADDVQTVAVPAGECLLPGDVIDALSGGVSAGADRMARAEVVTGIVREIFETVAWRYGEHADADELASLHRVLAEAEAHRDRMQSVRA